MTDPHFVDLKPFPGASEQPPAHHNRPPLEDQILLDFEEALRIRQVDERIPEIIDAASRAPTEIINAEQAGSVGDLIALAKAAKQMVEDQREILNRPLLTAQRSLKGKADGLVGPMDRALAPLREALDAFVAAEADEPVHGDLGARVGTHTVWEFEITDAAKLPLAVRRHPTVREAMEKVIRGMIKAGERRIAGVKIWSTTKATVR